MALAVQDVRIGSCAHDDLLWSVFRRTELSVPRGCRLQVQWVPSYVEVPGNDEPYRLAASAWHFASSKLCAHCLPFPAGLSLSTLVEMLLLALGLLQHSFKVSAIKGLCCSTVSGLTVHMSASLNLFRVGQTDSPNSVHCNTIRDTQPLAGAVPGLFCAQIVPPLYTQCMM